MALHCEEDCGSWRVYSDDGDFDANCDDEAMARTVTASFDMLAALEGLVHDPLATNYCDRCGNIPNDVGMDLITHEDDCPMLQVYIAIAKAKGE